MLKSTHRLAQGSAPLPAGWTEHKAPTGHTYYYNAEKKHSTYDRPTAATKADTDDFQIDYNATAPDQVVQASLKAFDEFHKNNAHSFRRGQGQFTGGRSYQDRSIQQRQQSHGRYQDRPRSKAAIPNCHPWILVKTKFGRRFVHNTETKDSFWKFPQDVMMAVIEMDRLEDSRAKNKGGDEEQKGVTGKGDKGDAAQPGEQQKHADHGQGEQDYDSDEYEEVEVTDDEGVDENGVVAKRPRLDQNQENGNSSAKPVEFDEDDIAWQLAQMEGDDDDDDGDGGNYSNDEGLEDESGGGWMNGEDEDEGLTLTAEDSAALFRSLLDDHHIDPYSTFDALIEYNSHSTVNTTANNIIDDPRWLSQPTMSSRRHTFTAWARDRIAQQQSYAAANSTSATPKPTPRLLYMEFLMDHASPKLYWPEFKRKHKKEPPIKDLRFPDKEKEKLYREYVAKLKGLSKSGDEGGKAELVASLKATKGLTRAMAGRDGAGGDYQHLLLPEALLKDVRFYLVRDRKVRDELVQAYLHSLRD